MSGWTIDTLREDMISRLSSLRLQLDERHNNSDKAVTKAEVANEKRFENVNEFRAQLADQVATFISRSEADLRIHSLADKLDTEVNRNSQRISELELRLTSRLDLTQGRDAGAEHQRAGQHWAINIVLSTITSIIVLLFGYGLLKH